MPKDTPTPRPTPKPVAHKVIEIEEVAIVDAPVEDAIEIEEVAEVAPVVEEVKNTEKSSGDVPPASYAVTTDGDFDNVYLSKAVYKNMRAMRSLTVFHIQRRLREWGFISDGDNEGFYGDATKASVEGFQKLKGHEVTGFVTMETLVALFEGDNNVKINA